MFHAAGLASGDGRVVALVGPSGRGKTTASRALGRAMGYITDETVAFRPDLSVIPYPKPLSIGHRPGVKTLSAPGDLGMRVAEEPLTLGALVLLDRRTERTEPHCEDVPLCEAIGDLVAQSSSFARIHQPIRTLADVVSATGGVRRIVYSDADDLEALVAAMLGAPAMADAEIEAVAVEPVAPAGAGAISRAPFIDAQMIDGRLVVLTERRLHVLDGIGPALWRGADGISVAELGARVRDEVGEPPGAIDGMRAMEDAVAELTEEGLLERG